MLKFHPYGPATAQYVAGTGGTYSACYCCRPIRTGVCADHEGAERNAKAVQMLHAELGTVRDLNGLPWPTVGDGQLRWRGMAYEGDGPM